jgi:sigma-B regulation protein RsbU (phosphoserine phosphatase)
MLDELRRIIITALNPERLDSGGKDGMDIALISIFKSPNSDEVKINFAGANNGLHILTKRNNEIELLEFKGDKQPVGFYSSMKPFVQQEIVAKKGDILYMFTDGYADQFGGPKGKKFMAKKLKQNLIAISAQPLSEQKQSLDNALIAWQNDLEQVDDVTVIGIKIG